MFVHHQSHPSHCHRIERAKRDGPKNLYDVREAQLC
jgi:hypothetical protein